MAIRDYIRTIGDLEKLYYSNAGAQFIQKDAPLKTTTTGVYQAKYGANVWAQLNMEANAFGVLPKVPWGHSGWRVITARGATKPSGGVAENADLPATEKPTFAVLTTAPKTVAHNFDVSEVQDFLAAESDDDAVGDMAFMRQYYGTEHKEQINSMLLTPTTTLCSYNFDSIDRVVSSLAEELLLTAGDCDIYSIDRSGDTNGYYDAYVSGADSATDRSLTDSIISTVKQNCLSRGANPTFWLTGYDTLAKIEGLYETTVRYHILGETEVAPSINGISAPKGVGVGIKVSTLKGYPVILSKDVTTTGSTISVLYLLDTSNPEGFDLPRLSLKIAKPTQYFEAGMNTGDPFGINRLGTEGMYRTMGELICTFFRVQGKAINIL